MKFEKLSFSVMGVTGFGYAACFIKNSIDHIVISN